MAQIFQFQKNSPGRIDAGNNVIIAEVLDVHPPATPTFEQARKQMEDRYRQERANQLLLQKSQELADRARNLQDIKKAAKVLNLPVKTSDLVAPNGQVPDIGSIGQNAPQIFDLNKGDISQPVRTATGAAVLQITDRQEPGPEELAKQKDQIRERLAADRRNQALNEFARNVRDRMMKDGTIKINKQEEARLTSGI